MPMKTRLFTWILFTTLLLPPVHGVDFFHCKSATCHDFKFGLKQYPRQKEYLNTCHETIRSVQDIVQKYGKCFDQTTGKLQHACIMALASTIKSCVQGLEGLTDSQARYYCGHRLMQNCAKFLGVERFPFHAEYPRPAENT